MTWLIRLSDGLNRLTEPVVALLAAFFTGLLVVSVFSRYVFDVSIVEGVELTRIAFLWSVFLAAASVAARQEHVRITFAVAWLPDAARAALFYLVQAIIVGFGVAMAWFGMAMTLRMAATFLPTLQVSQAWLYAALPLSGVLIVIHAMAHMVRGPATDQSLGQPAT